MEGEGGVAGSVAEGSGAPGAPAEPGFSWNTECFSGDYLKEVTQAALVRVLRKGHGAAVGWRMLGVLQGETSNHTHTHTPCSRCHAALGLPQVSKCLWSLTRLFILGLTDAPGREGPGRGMEGGAVPMC